MPKSFVELPPTEQAFRDRASFVLRDCNITTTDDLNEGQKVFFNLSEQLPKKSSNVRELFITALGHNLYLTQDHEFGPTASENEPVDRLFEFLFTS
jgi:hypothetical protein